MYSLIIDPDTTHVLYVATMSGVFKSTDGAESWFASSLSDVLVRDLAIDPQNPSTLYAETSSGLFKSTDAGDTWFQLTSLSATKALVDR